eukprot:symbB.v1.2.027453.t1/scaffold2819.1/size69504/1
MEAAKDLTRQIARSGSWQKALELLQSGPRDIVSLTATMKVCMTTPGKWPWALHLYQQISELRLQADAVVSNAAIHACVKGDAWQQALDILNSLQDNLRADVVSFSSAMAAVGGALHWEQALDLLDFISMIEVQVNHVAYLNSITACAKGDAWQSALAMTDMEASCNVALGSIAEWHHAISFFTSMQICRILISSITLRATIRSCEKGKQWQYALLLSNYSEVVDETVYSAAVAACESSSVASRGLMLLKGMQEKVRSSTALWSLARLAENSPENVKLSVAALQGATRELQQKVSAPTLATLSWAMRTLGIAMVGFQQRLCQQSLMQLEHFNLEELRHVLWGLCTESDVAEIMLTLQEEVYQRVSFLDLRQLSRVQRRATEDDLLTILWALNFAGWG